MNLSEAVADQLRALVPYRGDRWGALLNDAGGTLKSVADGRETTELIAGVAGGLVKAATRLGVPMDTAGAPAAELARLLVVEFWLGECAGSLARWPQAWESLTDGVLAVGRGKGGRPAKAADDSRKVRTYYATDGEYAAMQAKAMAASTDLSGLIRRAILGQG